MKFFLLPGCLRRCRIWKQNKSETKHEIVSLFCGKLNQIYFVSRIGLKAGGQNFTACRVRSRSVSEITVKRPSTLPSSTSLDGQTGSSNMKKISSLGCDSIKLNYSAYFLTSLAAHRRTVEKKDWWKSRQARGDARCLRWPFKVFGIFIRQCSDTIESV